MERSNLENIQNFSHSVSSLTCKISQVKYELNEKRKKNNNYYVEEISKIIPGVHSVVGNKKNQI
jgi:hypothetical protein